MQLEDLNSYEIIRPIYFIQASKRLVAFIDCPPEENSIFSDNLTQNKRFCPMLFEAFGEMKKPLKKRSLDERAYLKEKLLEDVEANVAAANAQFGGEKHIGTHILPSDPDACMERLDNMESEIHTKIQALQLKLKQVGFAQDTLELIQKNKVELEAFDKTPFTRSLQQEQPALKRKKAGPA